MKKLPKFPQIRVKGFTQEWSEHLLNYYLETSQEKNFDGLYQREDVLSVSGDYGIVNQIEFQGRSFAGASVLNYGVVHTGDVVYTKSPLKENPYGIIKTLEKLVLFQHYMQYIIQEKPPIPSLCNGILKITIG